MLPGGFTDIIPIYNQCRYRFLNSAAIAERAQKASGQRFAKSRRANQKNSRLTRAWPPRFALPPHTTETRIFSGARIPAKTMRHYSTKTPRARARNC